MPELSIKETKRAGSCTNTHSSIGLSVCGRPWMESLVWLPYPKVVEGGRTQRERLVFHRRLWPLEGTVINLLIALALSHTGLKSLAGCHLFM